MAISPRCAVKPLEDGPDLVPGEHDRQVLRPLGPLDAVEPRKARH
jgi:hypothetical protein